MQRSGDIKAFAISFAALPILGWFVSLVLNWYLGGEWFLYSEIAYAPLCIVTFPCEPIWGWLSDWFGEHTHRVIFAYALICAVIYGCVGAGIGYIVSRHYPSMSFEPARGSSHFTHAHSPPPGPG